MTSQTCELGEDVVSEYKKFKLSKSKTLNAICFKVNVKELRVEVDETLVDTSLAAVRELLPESVPRYVVLSYPHALADGRLTYPLVFVYYGCSCTPKLAMLYSSSKTLLSKALEVSKEITIQDPEELTDDFIKAKLAMFN